MQPVASAPCWNAPAHPHRAAWHLRSSVQPTQNQALSDLATYCSRTLTHSTLPSASRPLPPALLPTPRWGPMFDPDTHQIIHTQTRQYAREACEGALKRLNTDCLDLFTLRGPVQVCVYQQHVGCMCVYMLGKLQAPDPA